MLGVLSETTGTRPSSFFNWNEEEEWDERLLFDLYVISALKKEEKKKLEETTKRR